MAKSKVSSAFTIPTQYPWKGQMEDTHATVLVYDNGDRQIQIKGDPNHRNNNPGNQRYGSDAAARKYGAIGRDPEGFGVFATAEDGRKATLNMIASSNNADKSIVDFMKKYAPESDNNKPKAYAEFVVNYVKNQGLGDISKLKMGQLSDKQQQAFAEAIFIKEGTRTPLVATFSKQEYEKMESAMEKMNAAQKYQYLKNAVNEKLKQQSNSDRAEDLESFAEMTKEARENMVKSVKEAEKVNSANKLASVQKENDMGHSV